MINIKSDFPIFKNNPDLCYLDSAATTQKPNVVIDAVTDFYEKNYSSIHRGIYTLSQDATEMYENVRKKAVDFISASDSNEIIFTSGTTEAINFAAIGYFGKHLKKGDIVVLSEMEHHSNIVPWLILKQRIGIKLFFIPVTKDGNLDYKSIDLDFKKVKLVSLTHASNVLGTVNPISEIILFFKKKNPNTKILIDAAQSIPHLKIDVKKLNCDFLVFSSHKMLGPTGVGVLWAKKELLSDMSPVITGGHMIKTVSKEIVELADIPEKLEAGTKNIEGVIGLGAAIDYIEKIGFEKIKKDEKKLVEYTLKKFAKEEKVKLFGSHKSDQRLGVFSFAVGNIHSHDMAEILNRSGVAVRSGHHCAQVLMKALNISSTTRASIYIYNTTQDIDRLFAGIKEVKKVFRI